MFTFTTCIKTMEQMSSSQQRIRRREGEWRLNGGTNTWGERSGQQRSQKMIREWRGKLKISFYPPHLFFIWKTPAHSLKSSLNIPFSMKPSWAFNLQPHTPSCPVALAPTTHTSFLPHVIIHCDLLLLFLSPAPVQEWAPWEQECPEGSVPSVRPGSLW